MLAIPTPNPIDAGPTAAELALLDAEITALYSDGGPSPLDRRRIRRAGQRVMREAAALGERPAEDLCVRKAAA
jgi:hypothetical protein